ncbi:MAG: MMPL family transporter [Acidobacteriota bacterium]
MLQRSIGRWADRTLEHPGWTLALLGLAVALAAPGLWRLELATDGQSLVPQNNPAVIFDQEVREHFELRDPIVVLIETDQPEGIFNLPTLERVVEASQRIAALDDIGRRHVMSLATEKRDRVYPGTVSFRTFLDPLPINEKLMEILRIDITAAGIVEGTLVSADRRAAAIFIGAPKDAGWASRDRLYRQIRSAVEPLADESHRISVVGAPVAESQLGLHILEDLRLLLPLSFFFMALVLWIGCRSVAGVVIALAEVALCQIFVFGVMGWIGIPVYLTTATMPVILTAIGLTDEIHVLWHTQRSLAADPEATSKQAARRALDRVGVPLVLTSLTTAIAFLSFVSSSIGPVRSLGLFTSLGIAFCLVCSLTAIPAAFSLLPRRYLDRPTGHRRFIAPVLRRMSAMHRRPTITLGAVAAVSMVAAFGVSRIEVQDSWLDGFSTSSEFFQQTSRVNEQLHGTHQLLVHIGFPNRPKAGEDVLAPYLDPQVLNAIGQFEDALNEHPTVGGLLGPYSHMTAVSYLWLGRRPGTRSIPEDPYRTDLVFKRFKQGRGEHRRREVIDDEGNRGVVTLFLKAANFRDTASLMRFAESQAERILAPLGGEIAFAGDVAVSQAMIPAIVRTQVLSVITALLGALLTATLIYGSLRTGLLVVTPAALAVLWIFGVMGWLGIPLGVATSMFCAIVLGVGVDFALHFYEQSLRGTAEGRTDPVESALRATGPAILADTFALALGFGVLLASQVPSNARLGVLVSAALIASSVLTLVGMATWMSRRRFAAR